MWDVRACRGCLAVKGKLEKISDGCKRLYTALTGLQIAEADGYPHYFCLECRTMVKKCLAFRRKSRRAHFVMKEIMSVRKQVTYSDIITVNRKKTNLTSSLGFWEPQKTCSIVLTEAEEPPQDIEPTGPYYTRVVDIKPEIDNIEPERVPTPIEEAIDVPDDFENNDLSDDLTIKDELLDIDLNDVFKDLNENDEEEAIVSPEPEFKEVFNVKEVMVDLMSKKVNKMSVQMIVQALEVCEIKVLSLDDQKQRMELKKISREFVHALYKCAMCLTIHKSMQDLIEHVAYHNSRRFDHECEVCRNKYPTVEELNIHVARCHMYEYKCMCNIKRYTLNDIVSHHKTCKRLRSHRADAARRRRLALATKAPLKCFAVKKFTQDAVPPGNRGDREPEIITEHECKCDICGKWLKTKAVLEKHITTKHKYLYTCHLCEDVFTSRLPAVWHAKMHRKQVKTWSCEDCDASFSDLKELAIHRKSHKTKITCNLCGLLFISTRIHYKHQLTEHKYISLNDPLVGDPQYKCSDCGIQFIDKRSLETHLVALNHSGASDIEFSCIPCKKIFEDGDQLETHYITCPINKYPRKCCYCPEMLANKAQYKRHYHTQHPTLQYRYTTRNAICDICGKSIHKTHLEAHLKLHAGSAHVCRHCGAGNTIPASHVTHMLCYHSAKPYCCALCPRRFQHKGDCRDHILKVHAPAKLYKCEFCAQEFSYFRHLREHSEKLHNLVIPSVKNKCKKSKTKVFVYAHMKIEISEEERQVVEKTEVCLIDYLDQKSKPVDYKDYFIFSEECDQIFRIPKRQRIRKEPKEFKPKVPKVEIESDIIIRHGDVGFEVENAVRGLEMKDETMMKIEKVEDLGTETENAVREIAGEENCVQENVDEEMKMEAQEMVIDEERPLEVFENDGKQFVVIDGELYRIACDDEE